MKERPPGSGYLITKAERFLKLGPDIYRKGDALNQPPENIDENTLAAFVKGCEQICAGIGFTKGTPIEGLNIPQGYDLARLFHFEVSRQEIAEKEFGKWTTDKVLWKHFITDKEITIYIRVIQGEARRLP